jgi:transposase
MRLKTCSHICTFLVSTAGAFIRRTHLSGCTKNAMKRDLPSGTLRSVHSETREEALDMFYAGLDLSRKRLDVHVMDDAGETVEVRAIGPDADGLRSLVATLGLHPVRGALESMNGSRFVHDQLELHGWDVEVADAQKVKGLAPLACKTDRIDARVLAELCRRDLVPAIWLPTPGVRAQRERARFRLHLVRHRTALKNRIHSTLTAFGHPCPVSDLFGVSGRELLASLQIPEPWAATTRATLELVDGLDREVRTCETELRRLGADHPYVSRLQSIPGVAWVLGYTIASEIGDIARFRSAKKLTGYTGLCPRVHQSGQTDWRGPLSRSGPRYLRWALIEAAVHAASHPAYVERYVRTRKRLGRQRGPKIARVEVARSLAEAIWHMLTRNEDFAPAGPS